MFEVSISRFDVTVNVLYVDAKLFDTEGPFTYYDPSSGRDITYYNRTLLVTRNLELPMPIRVQDLHIIMRNVMDEINEDLPPPDRYSPSDFHMTLDAVAGLMP